MLTSPKPSKEGLGEVGQDKTMVHPAGVLFSFFTLSPGSASFTEGYAQFTPTV